MFSVEYFEPETSIPMMMVIPDMPDGYNGADTDNHPGDPKGTDTVPAWLTPGENVVNAEASRIPGNQEKIDQMNEEGRQIQKAQGGPIPTYESDGGFIQGLVDTFTLPKPPPGIEYRRHKDGSIGMWAGNIYRGKYKEPKKKESSFSKFLGVNYNYDGGSIPPMYAQEGNYVMPEFLSDKALNPILQGMYATETSSGANVKPSSAGAIGPMQILPTTAANPGMGVQPRTIKDISTLEGSQSFAKDYMRGIHQANPDFNLEEVVTAYHSGPENVRKAKANTEELGPQGQSYFGKVMSAINPISEAQAAGNISNAQMLEQTKGPDDGTRGVPPVDQIPKNRELPIEKPSIVDPLIEGIPIGPGGAGITTADIASDIVNEDQITIKQNQDAIPVLESNLQSAKEEEAAAAKVINDKQAEGNPIYQDEILRHQEAKAKVNSLSKTVEKTKEETKIAQENVDQAVPPIQNYNTETGEFDIPEAKDKDIPDPSVQSKKDAAITEAMKNFRGKTFSQPSADELKEVERLGSSSQGEGIGTTVMGYFKDMFKDLFSGPELARMAVMYAGSRLMGYDHGGSLQYSMKQYIDRVDAANTQFQKDIRDDDYQDFTEESRKEFEETRDYSVLKKKSTPVSMTETTGTTYVRGVGIVNTVKLSDKTEGVLIGGKPVRITQVIDKDSGLTLADIMEPVDKEVHSVQSVRKRLDGVAEEARKSASQNIGLEEGKGLSDDSSSVAMEAASKFNKILLRNGASIAQAEDMEIVVNGAIKDYYNAKAQAKRDGTKMPLTVEAYIEQRMIEPLTNNTITADMVRGTSADNLRALNKRIYRGMDNKDKRNPAFQTEYRNEWAATKAAWQSIGDERAEWIRKAEKKDGYSAFTLWMSKTADEDIDKILEEATK